MPLKRQLFLDMGDALEGAQLEERQHWEIFTTALCISTMVVVSRP